MNIDAGSNRHIAVQIMMVIYLFSGPLITRLLYVGNLPSEVTEEAIKSCFTDAVRVILPSKEDSSEKLG
jgi:hypothetical protein